jgi:GTP-binding protein LepA
VPIVNEIDLPRADAEGVAVQLAELLGDDPANVLRISAKTGDGVEAVLDAIIARYLPRSAISTRRRGR